MSLVKKVLKAKKEAAFKIAAKKNCIFATMLLLLVSIGNAAAVPVNTTTGIVSDIGVLMPGVFTPVINMFLEPPLVWVVEIGIVGIVVGIVAGLILMRRRRK